MFDKVTVVQNSRALVSNVALIEEFFFLSVSSLTTRLIHKPFNFLNACSKTSLVKMLDNHFNTQLKAVLLCFKLLNKQNRDKPIIESYALKHKDLA